MKSRVLTTLALLFLTLSLAQNGINYKALIKDNSGNAIVNQIVTVQFQILESGTTNVYQETHNPTTDANGIIIVNIGEGTVESGNFVAINWDVNDHFLNVQIDTGDGLEDLGTTQFKSVPYAKYAETAGQVTNMPITDLKYPDGFIGMTPVNFRQSGAAPHYTVPEGKNLYITSFIDIEGGGLEFTNENTVKVISGLHGTDFRNSLINPIIAGPNETITVFGNTAMATGFLVDAKVEAVKSIPGTVYEVPTGKILVILNNTSSLTVRQAPSTFFRTVNSTNGLNTVGTGIGISNYNGIGQPILVNEGDAVNSNSRFTGYLMDK